MGMEYKDYYKILGVERDVREAGIKTAYRRLARKFHPDVSKDDLSSLVDIGAGGAARPEEQVKDILNRISELKTRLTDNELEKCVRAMGILIRVEGFPAVGHEELEDFLSAYESDAIPDAFVFD